MIRSVFLLCCLSAVGQVQEEIQVVLRQVRVHVVDKDGEPIKGLSKDDFLIREGKSHRDLSTFEEVDMDDVRHVLQFYSTDDKAVPHFGRSMVIMIDSSNMVQEAFEPMIDAVQQFVEHHVDDNDLVKVVQMEEQLIHLSEFTSDKAAIQTAVGNAKYTGYFQLKLRHHQSRIFTQYELFEGQVNTSTGGPGEAQLLQNAADQVIQEVDEKERQKLIHARSFRQSLAILSRILGESPGSRAIYLFTGGSYIQSSGGQHVTTARDMDDAVRAMNAANVTLYSFLHTPPEEVGVRETYAAGVNFSDSLRIANLLERYVSREHRTRIRRLFATTGAQNSFFETHSQVETGPRLVGEATGGFFTRYLGYQDMAGEVDRLAARSRHYYTLGYTVDPKDKNSSIDLELVDPQKGWKLVYGEHVSNPQPFRKWDEEDRQLSFEVALLYSDTTRNDLDSDFGHHVFRHEDQYVIPMYLTLPKNTNPKRGYELGLAVFDGQHRPHDLLQQTVTPPKDLEKLLLYNVMISDVPPHSLKYFLRNLDTGEVVLQELEAEVLPAGSQLTISPIVFSTVHDFATIPLNHVPEQSQSKKKFMPEAAPQKPRRELDPLVMQGVLMSPAVSSKISAQPMDLLFHVTGIKGDPSNYNVRFNLTGESSSFVDGFITAADTFGTDCIRFSARVDLSQVPSGDYRLDLQIFNTEMGVAAVQSCSFSVL
ncbi:MAG: VWA domain-containing protein [Acidobacteria bacterium]|nr:VWA domain-containing protein [Acidobacteriota bacterium]